MLIRSQCQLYLINLSLNDLFIIGDEIRASHPLSTNTYTLLGTYASTKRAIEVLDEIEERFLGMRAKPGFIHNKVFRMPEK